MVETTEATAETEAPRAADMAPGEASASPAPQSASLDDLDAALRQFEDATEPPADVNGRANGNGAANGHAAGAESLNSQAAFDDAERQLQFEFDQRQIRGRHDAEMGDLRDRLSYMNDALARQAVALTRFRDQADFANVKAEAKKIIGPDNIVATDEWIERWLHAEASANSDFYNAVANRYSGDDQQTAVANLANAERLTARALKKMRADAHAEQGRQAYAYEQHERGLVAAAVLKSAGAPPPPSVDQQPDYGHMTENEFRAAVRKNHGYDPA